LQLVGRGRTWHTHAETIEEAKQTMRYPARCAAFLLAFGFVASATAQNTMPPNDTDLRAAYCIPLTKRGIGIFSQELSNLAASGDNDVTRLTQKDLNEANDKLRHLQSYLVPRLKYLDAVAVRAAQKRGEHDAARLNDPDLKACSDKCWASIATDSLEASKACLRSCEPEMLPRIWACNDLSWLPF
jgi:hypothetical protein